MSASPSFARGMEALFDQIPLGGVSTSMTINSPAQFFGPVPAVAENKGVDWSTLGAPLPERHFENYHRAEGIHLPAKPSMRLVIDTLSLARSTRRNSTRFTISGTTSEGGFDGDQELAFTSARRIEYVEWGCGAAGRGRFRAAPFLLFFTRTMTFSRIAKRRRAVSGTKR